MRTIWVVQAGLIDQQVGEDFPAHECRLDDARNVVKLHAAVPDALRVNHHGRPVLALVETPRVVCPGK